MGKRLGTLVVIIDKAKNLVNKQRIGKQDPYCTIAYNSDKKQTKVVKRGGQTPVWDEEMRFEIWETGADELSHEIDATGGIRPVKESATIVKKGAAAHKKELKVAVWADDPKDPELVGENVLNITDIHTKGEWDDWLPLLNKGRFQGEVKMELTFYSADPEPPKKLRPLSGKYSGPGTFEASIPSRNAARPRPTSMDVSSSSRSSTSFQRPDLYSIPAHLRPGQSAGTSAASSVGSRLSVDGSSPSLRSSTSHSNLSEFGRVSAATPDPRERRASFNQLSASSSGMLSDPSRRDSYNASPSGSTSVSMNGRLSAAPLPPPTRRSSSIANDTLLNTQLSGISRSPSAVSVNKPLPLPIAPAAGYQNVAQAPPFQDQPPYRGVSPAAPLSSSPYNLGAMSQALPPAQSPIHRLHSSTSSYDLNAYQQPPPQPVYQQPPPSNFQPGHAAQNSLPNQFGGHYIDPRQPSPQPVAMAQQPQYGQAPLMASPPPVHHTPYEQVPFPQQHEPAPYLPHSHSYPDGHLAQPATGPPRSQSTSFHAGQPAQYNAQPQEVSNYALPPPPQPASAPPNVYQQQPGPHHYQQEPFQLAHSQSYHQQPYAPQEPAYAPQEQYGAGYGQEQSYGQPYGGQHVQGPDQSNFGMAPPVQQTQATYQPMYQPNQSYMMSPPPQQQQGYQAVHFTPTHVGAIPPAVPPRPYASSAAPPENTYAPPQQEQPMYGHGARHSSPLPMPPAGRPLPQVQPMPSGWSAQQYNEYLRSQAHPM